MPQMGVSVAEGTITDWRKRPGDWVERDETIVEISTDKVETEVPSPASGRVRELLVEEGATVDVGTLLATIETGARAGEPHADESAGSDQPAAAPANGADTSRPCPRSCVGSRPSTHVDLARVQGTGRRGRVTKQDMLAFIEQARPRVPAPLHTESPYREEEPPPAVAPAAAGEPLSPMRRQIGEHMVRSLPRRRTAPRWWRPT